MARKAAEGVADAAGGLGKLIWKERKVKNVYLMWDVLLLLTNSPHWSRR
jgi:hypothetical protein